MLDDQDEEMILNGYDSIYAYNFHDPNMKGDISSRVTLIDKTKIWDWEGDVAINTSSVVVLDLENNEDKIASAQTTTNQVRISNKSRQTSTWLNNYEVLSDAAINEDGDFSPLLESFYILIISRRSLLRRTFMNLLFVDELVHLLENCHRSLPI